MPAGLYDLRRHELRGGEVRTGHACSPFDWRLINIKSQDRYGKKTFFSFRFFINKESEAYRASVMRFSFKKEKIGHNSGQIQTKTLVRLGKGRLEDSVE